MKDEVMRIFETQYTKKEQKQLNRLAREMYGVKYEALESSDAIETVMNLFETERKLANDKGLYYTWAFNPTEEGFQKLVKMYK